MILLTHRAAAGTDGPSGIVRQDSRQFQIATGTIDSRQVIYSSLEESELLDLATHGAKEAFEELVRRARPLASRVVRRLTANDQDAEDALQNALLLAYTKLYTFKRQSQFRTWLVRIAMNSSRLVNRKAQRVRGRERSFEDNPEQIFVEPADHQPNPYEQLLLARRLALAEQTIHNLPASLKEVLLARYATHCSIQEIADGMGLTRGAVKSRLSRVRTRISQSIQPLI